MATAYRRPSVSVTNLTAPANGRQETGLRLGVIAEADDGVTSAVYDVTRAGASDDTDFIDSTMTSAEVAYRGYNYTKDVDFAVIAGDISWAANTTLATPYLLTAEAVTGASLLPIGVYRYMVVAIKCGDENYRSTPNSWGGTLQSNEKTITLTVPAAVRLTWVEVPQADGYRIYRTLVNGAAGSEKLLATVIGEAKTFTDLGVYTPSALVTKPYVLPTTLPGYSEAYRKPPYSKVATAGTFVGQAITEATTAAAVIAYDAGALDVALDGGSALLLRDIDFRDIDGTDTVKCGQIADIFEYFLQNASGTKAKFYGGDASLNLAALKAVTAGRVKFYSDNKLLNGDLALVTSTTKAPYWDFTGGGDWTVATGAVAHASGAGTDVLQNKIWAPTASRSYLVTFTINSLTAANLTIDLGGAASDTVVPVAVPTEYSHVFTTASTAAFKITAANTAVCSLSNFCIREICETSSFSLASANQLSDVAALVQTAMRAATGAGGYESVTYNVTTNAFEFESGIAGRNSRLTLVSPSAGTDLTVAGLLYTDAAGYEIAGAASAVTCTYNTSTRKYTVTSATTGTASAVAITQPSAGDDLWIANAMYFNGGTATAGVAGSDVVYTVTATLAGGDYFTPETIFTVSDAATKFGGSSDMAFYAEKVLLAPPSGNGGRILIATGVPTMDRSTARAAMTAQESIRTELSTIITTDVDIIRDHYAHCAAMSTAAKSMWRVGLAMCRKTMSVSSLVALAAEFNSQYYGIIWDNISEDDNVSPYVGALLASLPSVADSVINERLYFDETLLSKPRLDRQTVDYLLANGVMVLDYNDDGVPCIIDDVMTAGSQYDLTGAITDTMIKYGIKAAINPLIGKVRINADGMLAIKLAVQQYLDGEENGLIDRYDKSSVVVTASTSDRYKALVSFSYYRVDTLKRVDVSYYVI